MAERKRSADRPGIGIVLALSYGGAHALMAVDAATRWVCAPTLRTEAVAAAAAAAVWVRVAPGAVAVGGVYELRGLHLPERDDAAHVGSVQAVDGCARLEALALAPCGRVAPRFSGAAELAQHVLRTGRVAEPVWVLARQEGAPGRYVGDSEFAVVEERTALESRRCGTAAASLAAADAAQPAWARTLVATAARDGATVRVQVCVRLDQLRDMLGFADADLWTDVLGPHVARCASVTLATTDWNGYRNAPAGRLPDVIRLRHAVVFAAFAEYLQRHGETVAAADARRMYRESARARVSSAQLERLRSGQGVVALAHPSDAGDRLFAADAAEADFRVLRGVAGTGGPAALYAVLKGPELFVATTAKRGRCV